MVTQRQRIFSANKWLYKICETKVNVCLNNNRTIIIILLIFAWILKSFFLQLVLCLWKDSEDFTLADLIRCWPHSRFLQTDLTLFFKRTILWNTSAWLFIFHSKALPYSRDLSSISSRRKLTLCMSQNMSLLYSLFSGTMKFTVLLLSGILAGFFF